MSITAYKHKTYPFFTLIKFSTLFTRNQAPRKRLGAPRSRAGRAIQPRLAPPSQPSTSPPIRGKLNRRVHAY